MGHFGIGNRLERVEDDRFLTGQGRYLDDIVFENTVHVVFLRSTVAHAKIKNINIDMALKIPGVLSVYTSADLEEDGVSSLPTLAHEWIDLFQADGSPSFNPDRPLLSKDKVRYVGEAVVMVIAETEDIAKDAAEKIEIDYDIYDAVIDTEVAHDPAQPQLFDITDNNTSFLYRTGNPGVVENIFENADHIVTRKLVNNRVIVNPLEARGAVGQYNVKDSRYVLHCDTQHPWDVRKQTATCLGIEPKDVRVVSSDIGGGFGIKYIAYPEHILVLWAAKKIQRTVKWCSGRTEAFLCDAHARDLVGTASLALDKAGKFLAIKAEMNANLGAYSSSHGPVCPTILATLMMPGGYNMPALSAEIRGVFTNTVPIDAYRGCGQPEGHYILERLVHAAAETLDMTQEEVRRRNYVSESSMPYTSATGVEIDSGNFSANLSDVLEAVVWKDISKRRNGAFERGKLYGIGVSSYVETAGADNREGSEVRFEENGLVTLRVGTKSSGQGHETVFAQMLHETLGVPFEDIKVLDGDTDKLTHGGGSGGSRSMQMAGTAIHIISEKVIEKAQKLVSHILEVAPDDIIFKEGNFSIIGTDRSMNIVEIADAGKKLENLPSEIIANLDTVVDITHENSTFPNGSHVCEVEVDPETGKIEVIGYFAISDYGRVMNPALLEGQVHGGVAQGIGQALYENTVFSKSGQLTSGSFLDYCMPRADDLPNYFVDFNEVPCKTNPLGVKGAGESGCIASLPAVMNALHDALASEGVKHIDMPATPERVWRAIRDASH
tara:strand:+ start:6170 stop:8503 length:2334 start_codon:yes stop_codon:yes gene_type:complete